MSVEEPQKTSIILDEVLSEEQDHDKTNNHCCESDEEDNIVLFDTTNTSNNKPDILKTITIGELRQEIEKLTLERNQLAKSLEEFQETNKIQEKSHQDTINKLETKCSKQQEQIESLQEQLKHDQEKLQSKLTALQNSLGTELDQATKLYQDVSKEKDTLLGKLAVLERNKRTLIEDNDMLNKKHKDALKENEKTKSQSKLLKNDISKLQATIEKLESIVKEKAEEVSKTKNEVSSLNTKLKWAQNKLKSETEAHKEVQSRLAITQQKLQQSKEEGEQIRNDMKAMIVAYQDSEEMKSTTLDVKLKETERELKQHEKEIADQMELYEISKKELNSTKSMLEEYLQENRVLKDKVSVMEKAMLEQDRTSEQVRCENNRLKEEVEKLNKKITNYEPIDEELKRSKEHCLLLEESLKKQESLHVELESDLESCQERNTELLSFSEKLTSLNAELQATKDTFTAQIADKTTQHEKLSKEITALTRSQASLREELVQALKESSELKQALIDKSKAVEQLSMALNEKENEVVVAKRKQAGSLKDLQKQLAECKRYIEQQHQQWSMNQRSVSPNHQGGGSTDQQIAKCAKSSPLQDPSHETLPSITPNALSVDSVPSPPNPDQALLVNKLIETRKDIAKRDEKVEFLEEHIKQLTEELQKKTKVIKNYLLREESGVLTTPQMDENKASRSRKGGVMASVFRSRASSHDMNLELSLEINQKLQAVLEDTILKNITLKENIKTLGDQIAILTQRTKKR